jgi:hypothetical protein
LLVGLGNASAQTDTVVPNLPVGGIGGSLFSATGSSVANGTTGNITLTLEPPLPV